MPRSGCSALHGVNPNYIYKKTLQNPSLAKIWETNIRQEGIKINLTLIIFTLFVLYNAKFVQCL